MKWLREFMERVNAVVLDEETLAKFKPTTDVDGGVEVVGELPDELKKMFIACEHISQDIEKVNGKVQGGAAGAAAEAASGKASSALAKSANVITSARKLIKLQADMNVAVQIFMREVQNEFPDTLGGQVGICSGWKVVTAKTA